MNYKILARKWRPKNFSEVIGQDYIIKTIKNSFILNKIHQSWIFCGTRGIGKTTIARLLAQVLNCSDRKEERACHICSNCQDITNNCFPDISEIDAASKTKVEEIKEILETAQYMPIKGKFKIYIIDEIHMLSKYSFNALLKILEEPPKHVKFILLTTEINKLPDTIISRCIFFHLKLINYLDIKQHLKKILKLEKIDFESSALKIISEYSNGSIRDALNLTEQIILFSNQNITKKLTLNMLGMLDKHYALKIIISVFKKNAVKIINLLNYLYDENINLEQVLIKILKIFYDIAILKKIPQNNDKNIFSKYKNQIFKISTQITYEELQNYYKIILHGKKILYLFPSIKMGIEITLLNLLHSVKNKLIF
ncbi:DNA polymerase III subunit tau, partial [isoform gamma] [Buchnera aphidicola (Takecallis arundicolens)]|uniref:DNA polymerase III subunit gamma/tau n=1 Tax=Buchnera aphidicola TaxID=9 RepID=UPI003463CAAB